MRIDRYNPNASDFAGLIESYLDFAPDVIVMVGTAETVTQLLDPPLQWTRPSARSRAGRSPAARGRTNTAAYGLFQQRWVYPPR